MPRFSNQCILDPALLVRSINQAVGSSILGPDHILDPVLRISAINKLHPGSLDSRECLLDPATELRQLELVEWGGSVGGGAYVAKAVHFDGRQQLDNAGIADAAKGLWSLWLNTAAGTDPLGLSVTDILSCQSGTGSGLVSIATGHGPGGKGAPDVYFQDNLDNNDISAFIPIYAGDSVWHNLIIKCDVNQDSGSRVIQMVWDGTFKDATILFEDGGPFAIDLSHGISVGLAQGADNTYDIADFQMWTGINPDLSDATNIAKFISAGKPVNPAITAAAFGTPEFLLSGDASTFATNQGVGGTFVATGTLTDASTSPSD